MSSFSPFQLVYRVRLWRMTSDEALSSHVHSVAGLCVELRNDIYTLWQLTVGLSYGYVACHTYAVKGVHVYHCVGWQVTNGINTRGNGCCYQRVESAGLGDLNYRLFASQLVYYGGGQLYTVCVGNEQQITLSIVELVPHGAGQHVVKGYAHGAIVVLHAL